MRLGARIWDLRRDGVNISMEMEEGKNRFGKKTRYARYKLMEGEGNGRE